MPTVNVNGYDIYFYDDDFTDPWRRSEVVLINHYGVGDSTLYRKWVPVLGREYRVIRWDRPGHGRSQVPPIGYKLTVDEIISTCIGFLDALGHRQGALRRRQGGLRRRASRSRSRIRIASRR